jgi:hypothetical protein
MSMFYAIAAILHPLNSPVVPRFDEIRTPFYVVFILYIPVEILIVYVRDGDLSPWKYLPLVIHLIVLAGIGLFVRNRRFDQLFAAWYLFVNFTWQLFARMAG